MLYELPWCSKDCLGVLASNEDELAWFNCLEVIRLAIISFPWSNIHYVIIISVNLLIIIVDSLIITLYLLITSVYY